MNALFKQIVCDVPVPVGDARRGNWVGRWKRPNNVVISVLLAGTGVVTCMRGL